MSLSKKMSFMLFEYGGLICALYLIKKLKSDQNYLFVIDAKKLRVSLYVLVLFVFFASAAFHDLYIVLYGQDTLQLLNNYFMGVLFVFFLLELIKSIKLK